MSRLRTLIAKLPDPWRMKLFPPYWLMRLKILKMENDWRHIRIKMPLTSISRNMDGSMFGGFQASLADVIAPLACAKVFPGWSVWTRNLSLDFHDAGRSDLELRFDFPPAQESEIQQELEARGRSTPTFEYGLYNEDGELCTTIFCTVAIRPKNYRKPNKT